MSLMDVVQSYCVDQLEDVMTEIEIERDVTRDQMGRQFTRCRDVKQKERRPKCPYLCCSNCGLYHGTVSRSSLNVDSSEKRIVCF